MSETIFEALEARIAHLEAMLEARAAAGTAVEAPFHVVDAEGNQLLTVDMFRGDTRLQLSGSAHCTGLMAIVEPLHCGVGLYKPDGNVCAVIDGDEVGGGLWIHDAAEGELIGKLCVEPDVSIQLELYHAENGTLFSAP